MMKRSKKAALVLMVPVATLLLAGCGEEREQAMVFTDPSECSAAALNSASQCEADYAAAQALHPQVAPKYLNKEECEVDFGAGNCETAPQQTTSGGSVFMPMMMGFLAGQMLNKSSSAKQSVPTQPLYKSKDDLSTFRTATNQPVARQTGPVSVMPSRMQVAPGKMASRGGFGAQAQRRSDQQSASSGG